MTRTRNPIIRGTRRSKWFRTRRSRRLGSSDSPTTHPTWPGSRTPRTAAPRLWLASRKLSRNEHGEWRVFSLTIRHRPLLLPADDRDAPVVRMADEHRAMERRLAVRAGYIEGPFSRRQLDREATSQVGLGCHFLVLLPDE